MADRRIIHSAPITKDQGVSPTVAARDEFLALSRLLLTVPHPRSVSVPTDLFTSTLVTRELS